MQFVLIAKDATDADALNRRLATRDAHLKNIENNMPNMKMGAATLDDKGSMNGSVMVVEFPSRDELDKWMQAEPYIQAKVWGNVEVIPCKIGPAFIK